MSQSEQRFSDMVGEEYDLFGLALPHQDEIQKKSVETLIKHFQDAKSIDVLEIGFGTGITSKELLKANELVQLVAIDNEPLMLEKAMAKLKTFPLNRFKLETIDALEFLVGQKEGSFDAIVSVWVLHNLHTDFRSSILKEIYRVLKPNGIFVNGDKIAVSDPTLHKEHLDWQLEQFNVFEKINRPELKKEWTEHYLEDEKPERIMYEDIFLEELTKIGFTDCQITNRNYLDAIFSAVKQ